MRKKQLLGSLGSHTTFIFRGTVIVDRIYKTNILHKVHKATREIAVYRRDSAATKLFSLFLLSMALGEMVRRNVVYLPKDLFNRDGEECLMSLFDSSKTPATTLQDVLKMNNSKVGRNRKINEAKCLLLLLGLPLDKAHTEFVEEVNNKTRKQLEKTYQNCVIIANGSQIAHLKIAIVRSKFAGEEAGVQVQEQPKTKPPGADTPDQNLLTQIWEGGVVLAGVAASVAMQSLAYQYFSDTFP
ncbi:hypothetical protein EV127DRAFT_501354 [Xylaria flabelliformis]|nr:hypothetical protein EV127DRAFT_501354 [Xylaria flabelliformis]